MSYNNYGSGYGSGYDPYSSGYGESGYGSNGEPTGYISSDPYAAPGYGSSTPYGSDPYGADPYANQASTSPYGTPYGAPQQQGPYPVAYSGPFINYQYDAMHPPRPSVSFPQAIKLFFKNYANFYGRASRSEYWWTFLGNALLTIVFVLMMFLAGVFSGSTSSSGSDAMMGVMMIVFWVGYLALLIPWYSLWVRRLHDAGFSGFVVLASLFPYVGWIVPFVMCFMESKPEGVRYDNPNGSQPAVS